MSIERLDRSRPYGEIKPAELLREGVVAMYEQDGKVFDQTYQRVLRDGEPPPDPMAIARQAAKNKRIRDAVAETTTAVDAIYSKPPWRRHTPHATFKLVDKSGRDKKYPRSKRAVQIPQTTAVPAAQAKASVVPPSDHINLSAWGIGEAPHYLWADVRNAVRERYNVLVSQPHDALAVLEKEGVIPKSGKQLEAQAAQ